MNQDQIFSTHNLQKSRSNFSTCKFIQMKLLNLNDDDLIEVLNYFLYMMSRFYMIMGSIYSCTAVSWSFGLPCLQLHDVILTYDAGPARVWPCIAGQNLLVYFCSVIHF